MKFPALYRRYKDSPVIEGYYDIETETLFELKFPLPYDYSEEYAVTLDEVEDIAWIAMYKVLLERPTVLAVVLVNSKHISMVYPDKLYTIPVNNKNQEYTETTKLYNNYSSYAITTEYPIGFERTFCRTFGTLITPGRIYYNPETNKMLYKNEWVGLPTGITQEQYTKKDIFKILASGSQGKGIIKTTTGYVLLD